jgi:hypothetical protein
MVLDIAVVSGAAGATIPLAAGQGSAVTAP